jgi:hypothetical protein
MTTHELVDLYIPATPRGRRYQTMCYWFAAGHERAQREALKSPDGTALPGYWDVVDHSDRFGRYGAWCADQYENGETGFLSSIIDMFDTFRKEYA